MASAKGDLKIIDGLRLAYPGNWVFRKGHWEGENFTVYRDGGEFFREDTDEKVEVPKVDLRPHKILKIKEILRQMFGGHWKKHPWAMKWESEGHGFYIYRGTVLVGEKLEAVYRRSDTAEIILRSSNNKSA